MSILLSEKCLFEMMSSNKDELDEPPIQVESQKLL